MSKIKSIKIIQVMIFICFKEIKFKIFLKTMMKDGVYDQQVR